MDLTQRCLTCQDLVVDDPDSFRVGIEGLRRSSDRCAICFVLHQASEIYTSRKKSPVQEIEILKSKGEYGPTLILRWDNSDVRGRYQFLRMFYTSRGFDLRSLVLPVRKIIPARPSVKYYADTIAEWLTACLVSHQNCRKAQQQKEQRPMPARLLYIGTSKNHDIKIVDGSDPNMPYIAMSYCWGPGPTLTLIKQTLRLFQSSIPWNLIPKTLQDAITLTRQLQISFIWIDALCIFQDSRQEWQTESAKMKYIYKHARLVLSADRAANTNSGFLMSRRLAGHVIHIPDFHPETGHADEIMVVPDGHTEGHDNDPYNRAHQWFLSSGGGFSQEDEFVTQNPVFGRAWCLQEQILAARTVHFTDSEMIWECFQDSHCECEGIDEYNRLGCLKSSISITAPERQLWKRTWFRFRDMYDSPVLLCEWWGCVEQYSSRRLGVESDILPAVSGLAKEFPEDILGEYYSGQWSKDFPFGLLWYSAEGRSHHRAKSYTAPTWSWASVVGAITKPVPMNDLVAMATVTHAMVSPIGPDRYGQIEDASLSLTAPMVGMQVFCVWPEVKSGRISEAWDLCLSEEWPKTLFSSTLPLRKVLLDVAPVFPYDDEQLHKYLSTLDITCAFIAKGTFRNSTQELLFAMLLNPVPGRKGVFERVGVAQMFLSEQYRDTDLERHTITII